MQFDTPTAFAFATLLMLVNGAVLGVVHADLPASMQPSAARWRVGTLLAAVGCICLPLQQLLPPQVVLPLGNTLILCGLTLYWLSLRRFDGRDEPWWAWAPAAIGLLAVSWFTVVQPNLVVRVVVVSVLWVVLLGAAMVALWRVPHETVAISRRVLSSCFGVVALLMAGRAAWFLGGFGSEATVLDNGSWVNFTTPMVAAVLPIVGTTSYLMLCSERLRRALEQAAATDALTGLANRRTLNERGLVWAEEAKSGRRSLGVAVIDLDHFKSVNDRFGHAVGDLALQHVAGLLQRHARRGDLPARQGGEEFVVVFEAPGPDVAQAVGERFRQAVAGAPCPTPNGPLPLTVSIGVGVFRTADARFEDVVQRADEALYEAKRNGRNRVVVGP